MLLTSGVHGDEYEGQVTLSGLIQEIDPADVTGRIIVLPMANYPAAKAGLRTSPIDELNLNRVFPGQADGSPTLMLAHYMQSVLMPLADYALDLHSGGSSLMYLPTVILRAAEVNETVQHVTALQFKGAPDLNRRMRQQTMGSVGPAGFLLADDSEMYERTQRGVQSKNPEWLFLGRGEQREFRDEDGFRVSHATDETPSRGIWRHYRSLMEA